ANSHVTPRKMRTWKNGSPVTVAPAAMAHAMTQRPTRAPGRPPMNRAHARPPVAATTVHMPQFTPGAALHSVHVPSPATTKAAAHSVTRALIERVPREVRRIDARGFRIAPGRPRGPLRRTRATSAE